MKEKNPYCELTPGSDECFEVSWPGKNLCHDCPWWDEFCATLMSEAT